MSLVHAGVSLGPVATVSLVHGRGRCVWICCESSACWRVPGTVAVCGSTVSLVHAGVSLGRSLCVDLL